MLGSVLFEQFGDAGPLTPAAVLLRQITENAEIWSRPTLAGAAQMRIAKRPKLVHVRSSSSFGKGAQHAASYVMVQSAGVDPCPAQLDDLTCSSPFIAAETVNKCRK